MDLIREMVHVIERDRPKSFNLLIPKGSKLKKLYHLAQDDDFLSDEIAAQKLYDTTPSDKRYQMLKGNLISKLSELILVADHSDINQKNFIAVKFDCERQMTIAQKLLYINVYHNAERITKRVWRKAEKYFITEIELNCCQTLRKINYLKGFPDKVEKYHKLVMQKMAELEAVEQSKGIVQMMLSEIKFIRSQTTELATRCEAYVKLIEDLQQKTPFVQFNVLRIKLILAHAAHDHELWKTSLESIDTLFQQFDSLETEHTRLEVNVSRMKYLLSEQQFAEAKKVLKVLMDNTSYEAFNRFEVMAEQYQMLIYQGKLLKASEVVADVMEEHRFKKLDVMDQAAWTIRQAYIDLAMSYLDEGHASRVNQLDLQEFFRICAPLSKDKQGYHLQFVIVRAMLLIYKQSMDLPNLTNNLKVYYQRYLKAQCLPRTRLFFKALIRLTTGNMDEELQVYELNQLTQELKAFPKLEYVEIIRYDQLFKTLCMIHGTSQMH